MAVASASGSIRPGAVRRDGQHLGYATLSRCDGDDRMMIFEIYAKDTLVGHSALELGDPPMGVAFGKFIPAEATERFNGSVRRTMSINRGSL
jgi:hypothetical protein